MSIQIDDPAVEPLPPSCKCVYLALLANGPSTTEELQASTTLPPRTVRYATTELETVGAVEKEPYMGDARRHKWQTTRMD